VFDPPLPPWGRDHAPQSSSFSISMGAAEDLVKGSVEIRRTDRGEVLDWRPNQPPWASRQRFRSEISGPDSDSLRVSVTSRP